MPEALSLEHYRALFDERNFLIPDPQFPDRGVDDDGRGAAHCRPVCLCARTTAVPRPRAAPRPDSGRVDVPADFDCTPLYLLLRQLRLLDTYPGLVLPYITFSAPLAVWLLTGFFRQLSSDLEDAAMVDGASRLRALWDVILPLAAPGVATAAILTFLYCWNEFLFALSFTLGPDRYTVPVAVMLFRGRYQVPWGQVLAATVVATLPLALLVLAFQRRIVAGLTAGGSKG